MQGLEELFNNFKSNFAGLDQRRKAELLLYTQVIKLAKFEEFKKRERTAFEMVKNLFTFPGKFNKEQLELFSASFVQNTQACMVALEKGGTPEQLHDMENKLFASLLWALTFGCGVETQLKDGVEAIWLDLLSNYSELKDAYTNISKVLNLDATKSELMRKASQMGKDEIVPILS